MARSHATDPDDRAAAREPGDVPAHGPPGPHRRRRPLRAPRRDRLRGRRRPRVLPPSDGQPARPEGLRRHLPAALDKAGISGNIRPFHDGRNTAITNAAAAGVARQRCRRTRATPACPRRRGTSISPGSGSRLRANSPRRASSAPLAPTPTGREGLCTSTRRTSAKPRRHTPAPARSTHRKEPAPSGLCR
jgi:hypothetical protein